MKRCKGRQMKPRTCCIVFLAILACPGLTDETNVSADRFCFMDNVWLRSFELVVPMGQGLSRESS